MHIMQVLFHIKVPKEEEKDEAVNTDVDGVLPGGIHCIAKHQLEFVYLN